MAKKRDILKEPAEIDGVICKVIFRREGEEIRVTTEMFQNISGRELLSVLRTVILGMIESAAKIGKQYGLSDDELSNYLFGPDKDKT